MARGGRTGLAALGWILAVVVIVAAGWFGRVSLYAPHHAPTAAETPVSSASPTASSTPHPGQPGTAHDPDLGRMKVYDVLADGTLSPTPSGLAEEAWDDFVGIAGADYAGTTVSSYEVGTNDNSDLEAFVSQDDDPQTWTLAVNLAWADDESELLATLIHEYGHLLTLNTEQVDPDVTACPRLDMDEGCADPDSVIEAYYEQFWQRYGVSAPDADNDSDSVAQRFYDRHEADFVDEYAATNVGEDIAETWMTYVVEDHLPLGSGVVAQKLAFFQGYPDLVAIRDRIRAAYGDQLGLPPTAG